MEGRDYRGLRKISGFGGRARWVILALFNQQSSLCHGFPLTREAKGGGVDCPTGAARNPSPALPVSG